VRDDRRIARRRRLLVAAGLAPIVLTMLAFAVYCTFAEVESLGAALYVLVLSLPVMFGFYATAPLVAAVQAHRAPAEELDAIAPIVWCTLAAAAAGASVVAVALTTSHLAFETLWPGVVLQTLGWIAGDRLGARRRRPAAD
jgi:hypothetical protein